MPKGPIKDSGLASSALKNERIKIQLNPAIGHFKGLVKIMLYIEVFIIANIQTFSHLRQGKKRYS